MWGCFLSFVFLITQAASSIVEITSDPAPPLVLGDQLVLTCSATGIELHRLEWLVGGRKYSNQANVHTNLTSGTSLLTIQSLSSSDAGVYECKIAYRGQGHESMESISDKITITAKIPLDAPSLLPSHQSPYSSGSALSLECMAFTLKSIADDPDIETNVSFSKDGDLVVKNDRIVFTRLSKSDPHGNVSAYILSVVIKSLNRSLDAGDWSCNLKLSSSSEYVQPASTKATITLPAEEILSPSKPHNPIGLAVSKVQPNSAHMTWRVAKIAYTHEMYVLKCWAAQRYPVKTSPPINGTTNYHAENQKFGAWINGLKENTEYTCTVEASNSVGSTVAPNYVAFKTQGVFTAPKFGRPLLGKPRKFMMQAIGSRNLTFFWLPPPAAANTTEAIRSYTLECKSLEDDKEIVRQKFSKAQSGLTINAFHPFTNYRCSVYAENPSGQSSAVTATATTLEDVPDAAPRNFSATVKVSHPEVLILTWRPVERSHQNGRIISYSVGCGSSVVNVEAKPELEENDGTYSQELTGLKPDVNYSCQALATTKSGDGPPATLDALTVSSPHTQSNEIILVTMFGILFLVTIIALILLLVILLGVYWWCYQSVQATMGNVRTNMHMYYQVPKQEDQTVTLSVPTVQSKTKLQQTTVETSAPTKGKQPVRRTAPKQPSKADVPDLPKKETKQRTTIERAYTATKGAHYSVPVRMAEFSQHLKDLKRNDELQLTEEYEAISRIPKGQSEVARNPLNKSKNRYTDILPYDVSRVKLKAIPGVKGSDYINASYINGFKQKKAYIATQGPLKSTITDFWRMVIEHEISTIVMLAKCTEGRKEKCVQYWPEGDLQSVNIGQDMCITTQATKEYHNYTTRRLQVTKTSPKRHHYNVKHCQFTGWPDHGVPQYPSAFVTFLRHVRKLKATDTSPLLVHCSAGVGRSGSFILLDYMLTRIQAIDTINVYEFVCSMRRSRPLMIQTVSQYLFVHETLNDIFLCGDTEFQTRRLKTIVENVYIENLGVKASRLEKQFKLLEELSPKPSKEACSVALRASNQFKNRYLDMIPFDDTRVRLKLRDGMDSDYINASFINGYDSSTTYIATQIPLPSTIADFWWMVWKTKSRVIVMIHTPPESDAMNDQNIHWPKDLFDTQQFGHLSVILMNEMVKESYIVRHIEVSDKELFDEGVLKVTHFQYVGWPVHSSPHSTPSLLAMLGEVNELQQNSGSRYIVVMCDNGADKTGTLICIHAQQKKIMLDRTIDVFQFVKSARTQRPSFVSTLSHYVYCHEALLVYIDEIS